MSEKNDNRPLFLAFKVSFRVHSKMLLFLLLGTISDDLLSPVYYCGLLSWTVVGNQAYSVLSGDF